MRVGRTLQTDIWVDYLKLIVVETKKHNLRALNMTMYSFHLLEET